MRCARISSTMPAQQSSTTQQGTVHSTAWRETRGNLAGAVCFDVNWFNVRITCNIALEAARGDMATTREHQVRGLQDGPFARSTQFIFVIQSLVRAFAQWPALGWGASPTPRQPAAAIGARRHGN